MILLATMHQTLMTKLMIRKALRNATLEESLSDKPTIPPTDSEEVPAEHFKQLCGTFQAAFGRPGRSGSGTTC